MEKSVRTTLPSGSCLIETFGWWPQEGARHIGFHLERMETSATALGVDFPAAKAIALINALSGDMPQRCRLTLSGTGEFELTTTDLPALSTGKWRLALASERLQSDDPLLRHKTSHRPQYDKARGTLTGQADEVLFLNERDELCEGTITNLFLDMGEGVFLTPDLSSGLLPGILRRVMLDTRRAQEATLNLDDLRSAKRVFVGNSLRGLIPVEWIGDSIPLIP